MRYLVVVESPSKAKIINTYLGSDYKVLSSYGHVRDLPSKPGSVQPENGFSFVWQLDERGTKAFKEIKKAAQSAEIILLATDPDREGEAISWHISELLKEANIKKSIRRIAFYEITKSAIKNALAHDREIDQQLVDAYLARRALDYLFGFNLSPLLWRKLPGAKSAGRVQSVALRLIVEREIEIKSFVSQEYWSVLAELIGRSNSSFSARLTHINNKKLDKLALKNEAMAKDALKLVQEATLKVSDIEQKEVKRNPYPPFITSTLQQDAARKHGFSADQTMKTAQKLYEGIEVNGQLTGLITYMRTDSSNMAEEAISDVRNYIEQEFGDKYLPKSKRVFKGKVKNAQEAHEAIRPTDITKTPGEVKDFLSPEQFKLYDLIWKRTVACQMENAIFSQVVVDIASEKVTLRANGSQLLFDGFLKLYQESSDEPEQESDSLLPILAVGEELKLLNALPKQHFTQPPPRYTEASLVKKMEELGIGRPSTYANIISVLKDRAYVKMEKKQFVPEERGNLVTSFLKNFFENYVQYEFTANLENELDLISSGTLNWSKVLGGFWNAFNSVIRNTSEKPNTDILQIMEQDLGIDKIICSKCDKGHLGLKISKYGAFLGCSNYPECDFKKTLQENTDIPAPTAFAIDPETKEEIYIKVGPYGRYLQWGNGEKPKRISIPLSITDVTLQDAMFLKSLPLKLGQYQEKDVLIGLGKFGPYVKYGTAYINIPKGTNIMDIHLEQAITIIGNKK